MMGNISLGTFDVDVSLLSDGTFDVYLSHEGSSGEHYEHVSADRIGELVADDVECIAENYGNIAKTPAKTTKEGILLELLAETIPSDPNEFNSETGYGEPQHWVTLPKDRSLEIVYEETGDGKRYYSWRVHCNEQEFEDDVFHSTMGVIAENFSDDMNFDTRVGLLDWAIRVAMKEVA